MKTHLHYALPPTTRELSAELAGQETDLVPTGFEEESGVSTRQTLRLWWNLKNLAFLPNLWLKDYACLLTVRRTLRRRPRSRRSALPASSEELGHRIVNTVRRNNKDAMGADSCAWAP